MSVAIEKGSVNRSQASAFGLIPPREARAEAREALVTATQLYGESAEGLRVEAFFDVVARAEEECLGHLYFTGLSGFDPPRGDQQFGALPGGFGLPSA